MYAPPFLCLIVYYLNWQVNTTTTRGWELLSGKDDGQWYTNKDLFEMFQRMEDKMTQLSLEMQRTMVLIRDYNGLRERLDRCEQDINQAKGAKNGSKDMWGYVVGGVGALLALITYTTR